LETIFLLFVYPHFGLKLPIRALPLVKNDPVGVDFWPVVFVWMEERNACSSTCRDGGKRRGRMLAKESRVSRFFHSLLCYNKLMMLRMVLSDEDMTNALTNGTRTCSFNTKAMEKLAVKKNMKLTRSALW
jgi:hypothetical protein